VAQHRLVGQTLCFQDRLLMLYFSKDVPFPIFVTQNYWDQNLGPKPDPPADGVVNNTHIQDILFENFAGTIDE